MIQGKIMTFQLCSISQKFTPRLASLIKENLVAQCLIVCCCCPTLWMKKKELGKQRNYTRLKILREQRKA